MANKFVFNPLTANFDLVSDVSSFVVGVSSSTDNAVVRFDSTTGKLIQNSGVIISDSNDITGASSLTLSSLTSGSIIFAGTGGILSQDNTNFFWDDSANTGKMGGGVSFPTGVAVTAANYSVGRDADSTNQLHFNVPTGAGMEWSINDVAVGTLSSLGNISLTPTAASSGAVNPFKFTGAASTALTASTEVIDFYLNLSRTVQHATGAVALQRSVVIDPVTYSFVGASDLTIAATFNSSGLPIAGTNATPNYMFNVMVGNPNGGETTKADTSGEILFFSHGIANGKGNVTEITSLGFLSLSNVSLGNQTASLGKWSLARFSQITLTSDTLVRTVAQSATVIIDGLPGNTGAEVVFSDGPYGLSVAATTNFYHSATSTPAAIYIPSSTITFTVDTRITSTGPAGLKIGTITLDNGGGAQTVDFASGLYIAGAPVGINSVTLTTAYSIWVDAGLTRLDGGVAFAGSGQNTLSNYTESTFSPTVTLVGGAGNTVPVYSTNTGRYTRIGNRVFVDVYLTGDGGNEGAGTGVFTVAIPIASSASHPTSYFPCGYFANSTSEDPLWGQIVAGASVIDFAYEDVLNNFTAMTGAEQNNATRTVRLKFSYEC